MKVEKKEEEKDLIKMEKKKQLNQSNYLRKKLVEEQLLDNMSEEKQLEYKGQKKL